MVADHATENAKLYRGRRPFLTLKIVRDPAWICCQLDTQMRCIWTL